jgi:glycosyltransferase involved in cell wall biosynthesis
MSLRPGPCAPIPETGDPLRSVCFVVSSPLTLKCFLLDQIAALSHAYHLTCIANWNGPAGLQQWGDADVPLVSVPIERPISPSHDLRALWTLRRYFRANGTDVVHSFTPKAGLLAMTAAALAGVPVRIHTFTGQVWATRSGLARTMLKALDIWIAALATHILVDSESQRDFLVRQGVLSEKKSRVLANGSISGVDTVRFRPDSELRKRIRRLGSIPEDGVIFLYVGRLKADKGVLDLAQAFARLGMDYDEAWLLMVGPDEEGLRPRIQGICPSVANRLRFVDFTSAPQEYMAAADVLCLPSYREGFGSVVIEAAAAGIPAVASNIYGITDAVEPDATGLLHTAGDVADLQSKMKRMMDDPASRTRMGANARVRAGRKFSKELVTSAVLEFYNSVAGSEPARDATVAHARETRF